jgi:helix-turn-helix protein
MAKKKHLTNRDVLTKMVKELSDVDLAMVRERIIVICEKTIKDKEAITKSMENGFLHPAIFFGAVERAYEIVKFKDE